MKQRSNKDILWFFLMQIPYCIVGILTLNKLYVIITAVICSFIFWRFIYPHFNRDEVSK